MASSRTSWANWADVQLGPSGVGADRERDAVGLLGGPEVRDVTEAERGPRLDDDRGAHLVHGVSFDGGWPVAVVAGVSGTGHALRSTLLFPVDAA